MAVDPARSRSRLDFLLDNPILRYEGVPGRLRRLMAGQWGWALMVGLVGSAACGLLVAAWSNEVAGGLSLFIPMVWSLVTIVVPAAQASRTIARERQRGSWDALLMSRLQPVDIIVGKLLGALLPFWVAGLLLAPLVLMSWLAAPLWARPGESSDLVARYLSPMAISASFASVGLWFSLRSKTESSAQLATLLTLAVSYLLSLFLSIALSGFPLASYRLGSGEPIDPVVVGILRLAVLIAPGALALLDLLLRFGALERRGRT